MPAAPSAVAVVLSTSATVGTLCGVAADSPAIGAVASAATTFAAGVVVVGLWTITLRHGRQTGCYPAFGQCRFEQVAQPNEPTAADQLRLFEVPRRRRSVA